MDLKHTLGEGFVAGLIGAVSVAAWFLIVDVIAGQPFFTPAMLGDALFWRQTDPAQVQIAFSTVIAYTMVHVLAFVAAGILAAFVVHQVESFPATLYIVVAVFMVFEFGFYVLIAIVARPLLGALAWTNVAAGNLIAAAGMGYYLWYRHPRLRERLREHPLGEPADQGFGEPERRRAERQ